MEQVLAHRDVWTVDQVRFSLSLSLCLTSRTHRQEGDNPSIDRSIYSIISLPFPPPNHPLFPHLPSPLDQVFNFLHRLVSVSKVREVLDAARRPEGEQGEQGPPISYPR